jgi:hypothetical protein
MDIKQKIKDTVEDVRDAASEALHRSTAEAERARRDLAGDEMTTGEKIKSGANEAANRTQAEIDKAKRQIRDKT